MNEQKKRQAFGGGGILEDLDDEPFGEMTKDARVWRTYVKETDRWDKEMVDGRNSSLDVLLIFAALFSAISTTFIVASLSDLKPDHAETSAHALLAISRKLDAVVTGQHNTLQLEQEPPSEAFSPSRSSIVVNVLWLLSLSLSVAVSLIAMLAKDWCYKFMSGRTGNMYEQGRKRQQKWHGIEKWKMQEALAHLPGLMHLALCLFATGLCIYLWEVNVYAAVPVIVVTLLATSAYAAATVLPMVDVYCPYSTPVTVALISVPIVLRKLGYQLARFLYCGIGYPVRLRRALGRMKARLEASNDPWHASGDSNQLMQEHLTVPMDLVTSQMLAWMITNCEDSRAVDVAVLAIAGSRSTLPLTDFPKADAVSVGYSRLVFCVQQDPVTARYKPKSTDMLYLALRYCQVLAMLMPRKLYNGFGWDLIIRGTCQWTEVIKIQNDLLAYSQTCSLDTNCTVRAAVVASIIRIGCSFGGEEESSPNSQAAAELAAALLSHHASDNGPHISQLILLTLLDSCGCYLIERWRYQAGYEQIPLLPALAQLYCASRKTAPEVARSSVIALFAAAVAFARYPGGVQSVAEAMSQQKRALRVLQHFQTFDSLRDTELLFVFGITALLPHMTVDSISSLATENFLGLLDDPFSSLPFLGSRGIYTIPNSYTWSTHFQLAYHSFSPDIPVDPSMTHSDSSIHWLYALLLRAQVCHHCLFVPALVILCYAESEKAQHMCINSIRSLPVASSHSQLSAILKSWDQSPWVDSGPQLGTGKMAHLAAFYLQLLMAMVMLFSSYSLDNRQKSLCRMIKSSDRARNLTPNSQDRVLPSEEHILTHMKSAASQDNAQDTMQATLQLMVDFCHADPGRDNNSKDVPEETPGWVAKLQEIKDAFEQRNLDNSVQSRVREESGDEVVGM